MTGLFGSRFVRVYIVPGCVFQSIMVGGGYGTGREIVEYFTRYGALGGLLAMGIAFLALAIVIAASFELARRFEAYDYRNFFKLLLGRGWPLFEILIVLQFLLALAVLASAAGNILRDNFDLPSLAGPLAMLLLVGVLTFYGRELIVRALTFWSFFLYAVFIAFFASVLSRNGQDISVAIAAADINAGWWLSGFKYAMYNLAAVPIILYVVDGFENRADSVKSGIAAAAIAIVPAIMFQLAFLATYPEVVDRAIPVYWMMQSLGMSVLLLLYSVMLVGTFIETGAGMLQGINERVDAWFIERRGSPLARKTHAAIAMGAIAVSGALSMIGITQLIARGYGTMAWGFLVIYVIPLLTVGLYRLTRPTEDSRQASRATRSL